jgi:putative ATP-binding cassette transporter
LHTTPLTLSLPNGDVLLADTSLNIAAGDTVLIRGPSGCGKSTLLRALAGIWPYVSAPTHDRHGEPITYGPVVLPEGSVFMPQRPYFPEGTLRQALAYPDSATHYSDEALQNALYDALLPHLATELDVAGQWTQQLSGGEQQRLALARVLLKRPRWVFADEATSALDEAGEKVLYEKLLTMVREEGGGLVSIAHRPSVASYHETLWQFNPAPEGSVAKFVLVTN